MTKKMVLLSMLTAVVGLFANTGLAQQPCSNMLVGQNQCLLDSSTAKFGICDGRNTLLTGEHDNCGSCGHKCTGSEVCQDGNCVACPVGMNGSANKCMCGKYLGEKTWCTSGCTDFQNDAKNCGKCGHDCGDGICQNQVCYNTQRDNGNCGTIGNVCAKNTYCFKGSCLKIPERFGYCPFSWCQASCNDGFVIRDLCSPCDGKCNDQCKDHGGCKNTCSRFNVHQFEADCNAR